MTAYLHRDEPLLVVVGPSATGKSTVVEQLVRNHIVELTPSWTTRPARVDEQHEFVSHRFVTEQEFKANEAGGFFLECVELFGLAYRYGLPRVGKPVGGRVPLIMLRVGLMNLLARHYDNCFVYQIEDTVEQVSERLRRRETLGHDVGTRLDDYFDEITQGRACSERVFKNSSDISSLVSQVTDAIHDDFRSARASH